MAIKKWLSNVVFAIFWLGITLLWFVGMWFMFTGLHQSGVETRYRKAQKEYKEIQKRRKLKNLEKRVRQLEEQKH